MNIDTEIGAILESAKMQIQANLQTNNINASGRTSKSLIVRKTAAGFQLVMQSGEVAPAQSLEKGIPANVATWAIVGKIQNWIIDKKLTIRNVPYLTDRPHKYTQEERNLKIAAGSITHKIINKGTNRFTAPEEVVYSPVIEDVKKKVFAVMKNAVILTIKDKQTNP